MSPRVVIGASNIPGWVARVVSGLAPPERAAASVERALLWLCVRLTAVVENAQVVLHANQLTQFAIVG